MTSLEQSDMSITEPIITNSNIDSDDTTENMMNIVILPDAQLITMDGYILGSLASEDMNRLKATEGDILRCLCSIETYYLDFEEDKVYKAVSITPVRKCSERKPAPDPW
eukprot:CAMPEP_0182441046 /NCGR_PEP_ID=MMETSP1167-20130531/87461_1 /TAXON_ID=2988 /ORGANISM="Mallomonas Sp, Strain CCMP3275" /LENGTH=108 /DNA_ID=CAMNT_0024635185 /DNA_START=1285 /DNA_END=1608 /DNA_ORIENTATION=-